MVSVLSAFENDFCFLDVEVLNLAGGAMAQHRMILARLLICCPCNANLDYSHGLLNTSRSCKRNHVCPSCTRR